jgi:very-short-patch-repair endonuclease
VAWSRDAGGVSRPPHGPPRHQTFRAATAAINPGTRRTRSDFEDAFLTLCRKHRLPTPDSNTKLAGFEVDFHFPGTNLIVELDSYEYHRTPAEFDADRRKDAALKRKGYEVLRVSDAWFDSDPDGVAQTVRQLLERQLELARRREGLALVQAGHSHAE